MKFSNQALERLNRTVSMKILAGPTRFNGTESMYSASKGEEECSSNMVAQVIDDPSIGPQSVFVDWTKQEDFIIDTVTGLASSVGQTQGSSVTTLEQAFAVNNSNWTHVHSRNKKRNAQLGPPRPEGSDAGRASFDTYMCRDAGLYTYRLNARNILKSNSVSGQRNGLSGLPPRRITKPFTTRRKINGTWVTVLKHPNNMITIAKTGEIIRSADLPRNPSMTLDEFIQHVDTILADEDLPNQVPRSDMVSSFDETHLNHLKEKTKALKHAARVLVQAHQLARTPAHSSHRKEFSTLTQIAIDMANEVHPYGLDVLMKCSSVSSMRNKHKFQYRGKRTRYMNDVRQHNIRARAARNPARFAFTNSTEVNTNGRFSAHGKRSTNRRFFAHGERHTTTTAHSPTNIRDSPTNIRNFNPRDLNLRHTPHMMTRRTQVHSKKPHHAFMTFVVPPLQDIRPSNEEGDLPTEVQPTTIRRRDEGGRPQVVANITQEQDTSSLDSSFASPPHTYVYPSFPPNKTTEQLDEERTLAIQALKEWDGVTRDTKIQWIQHYIDLAHLESQTPPHVTPYDKFEHLFTALSPFFLTKGEGFLFDHFDMKEDKIAEIVDAIHPVYDNALIYAVPLKVASEGQPHQPFYSIFTTRIEQLVETTTTTLKNLERELDSFPSFDIATTTRSKKKTTKDKKKKKKKKKRNARRKSFNQYDSDSSSSSSSSSNSSSSTNSSSDSDDESTVAYNNIGTKANAEMSFSSNPKERKHQTSKVAKVLKRLHESAKQHHLSEYSVTRETIDKRKSYFRTWIETLKHIFFLDGRYSSLLAKYPLIDCSNISTTSNMALSQFLFTKLEASSRDQVRSCLNDHLDGVELLKYLQQNYGATTIMDCTKALQRLKDTTWEYQDTVDTFSNRFLRRAETYRVTLRSTNSPSKLKLEDEKLLTMYLEALTTTMPSSHPLHQTVQTKFVELESCITAGTAPSFKFIQVMHQMRHLETINLNNTTSTRQSYNKVRPRNQSRPPYVKANTAAESMKPSNQANLVTQSRKFKPVKCWGCGHHHNLRDCPTTSDEQKQVLYQQKREEKERRTNGQPNRSAHQQANKADTPKSEATPTTETSNPKNTVHKVTEMPRRRGTNFAAPVKHFSGMTRTLPHTSTLDREALKEMFTLIRDWLIDSGCTAHMSPVREDFIGDLEPHHTMVEVANGSLVEVQWRGTVKLLLIDKFDPSNQAMVYLRNVLYVPMLSRRLLSVAEWNQCGGQINFLTDKCRVQILDSDDFPIHTIDIDPIYAADEINNDRVLTVSAPKATPKKIRIEQELLHQRLGHRAISTLLLADEDDVWADVKLIADDEKFCETCKITTARRANRGSTPLEQLEEVVPGMCIMVDLVKNPVTESITSNSYFPFYLTITDMASRFFVPMGIRKKTSHDVFVALQEWATSYGPGIDYTMHMMRRIHGDYDSAFRSEELRSKAAQFNIKISFAAPRHQEQNGIHEANWRNIRNLAFAMMNQARVPKKFFHFAFEHAWKIHAVLPHKALTRADGKVQTPLGVYEGKPVGIESFRVLFCPVVITYDSINLRSKDTTGKQLITSYNRRNNPQRAIRGIHVGLPRHNTGYLVFVPQLNSVLHCNDVYFDENFESTLAYTQSRHPAHLDIVVTDAQPHAYDEFERTGSALWFCNKKSDPFGKFVQNFARADVLEAYDMDFNRPDTDSDNDSNCDNMPDLISRHDDTDDDDDDDSFNDLPDLMFRDDGTSDDEEEVNNTVATSSLQTSHPESINITVPTVTNMYDNATDAAISPPQRYPKRIRKRNPKFALNAQEISDQPTIPIPEEFVETVNRAYYMEVVAPMQQLVDMDPTMFLPAPENWKQILKLPPHVMDYWSASLLKELKELIKKETFVLDDPDPTDPIIPVTAKFRVKLTKDGMIEKLKSRIALRGDLMRDNVEIPDTWCPIAGFRAFKIFLATAAYYKKRIYQLDYVAAFLQADVIGRKFTTLPIEWKEMFRSNTEVHKWLGRPLRLTKSLYGDRVANLAWDETQSNWLTSPEIGFQRLPSERSIYVKKTAEGMMMVLNAVDDQLYFATTIEMKDWFEKQTERRFDVQKLGQAEWYLQSRITQLADYSIILDQSRYAALVAGRYLSPVNEDQIPTSIKVKYASPLPSGTVFTKQDCSQSYADVMKIQEEFGFEYAAAVGSLIYLMNTFVKLAFPIRKLAKFMQKPGRKHFEILKHLLHHIQCHRCSAGIKFYSDMKLSPLYQMMIETGNAAHADAPLILFTDSSFQDCPDTTKSTGGYLIFMRGGVVDNSSHLAGVVCHSSCEAEYCHATSGLMAAAFIRKVFNEILGFNSDKPLTIPLGIDSQSAMDTANSHKETSRTRHIARRYHYVRFAQMNSETTLFKVDGTRNPSNSMTKVLTADQLDEEAAIYQVEVDP